jgi:hypothetical protein
MYAFNGNGDFETQRVQHGDRNLRIDCSKTNYVKTNSKMLTGLDHHGESPLFDRGLRLDGRLAEFFMQCRLLKSFFADIILI